jgi:hypothetical protein
MKVKRPLRCSIKFRMSGPDQFFGDSGKTNVPLHSIATNLPLVFNIFTDSRYTVRMALNTSSNNASACQV